jgi:hypothetical protein
MKPTEKQGGAAFPWANDSNKEYYWINQGMSLRDYFAAAALQGQLSCAEIIGGTVTGPEVAGSCYEWADLMLAARKEGA